MALLRPLLLLALVLGAPTHAHEDGEVEPPDPTSAILLSTLLPGVGEWYNADFQGGYPMAECVIGWICPCMHIASMVDSAAGRTDDGMRFDFWSAPLSSGKAAK